jgi:hypothetical protein
MFNARSVFFVSCLLFAGCTDSPQSSQDATVDVVVDAASDVSDAGTPAVDASSDTGSHCQDASLDAGDATGC